MNNSAYTNAAATIALSFATEAAGVLGKTPDATWAEVAAGLKLEVSPTVPNHPELQVGPSAAQRLSSTASHRLLPLPAGGLSPGVQGLSKEPGAPEGQASGHDHALLPAGRRDVRHPAQKRPHLLYATAPRRAPCHVDLRLDQVWWRPCRLR